MTQEKRPVRYYRWYQLSEFRADRKSTKHLNCLRSLSGLEPLELPSLQWSGGVDNSVAAANDSLRRSLSGLESPDLPTQQWDGAVNKMVAAAKRRLPISGRQVIHERIRRRPNVEECVSGVKHRLKSLFWSMDAVWDFDPIRGAAVA